MRSLDQIITPQKFKESRLIATKKSPGQNPNFQAQHTIATEQELALNFNDRMTNRLESKHRF